jgi:hypothetical protein
VNIIEIKFVDNCLYRITVTIITTLSVIEIERIFKKFEPLNYANFNVVIDYLIEKHRCTIIPRDKSSKVEVIKVSY